MIGRLTLRIVVCMFELFDSITIEDGTLNSLCAEGASLPLRGADAEMKRPGDHYTFGPIVSETQQGNKRKQKHTHLSAHGKGSLRTNGQKPTKRESKKETKRRRKGTGR